MQWTLVGLGNPEKEYEGTRHNVGKDFLHMLAEKLPSKAKVVELSTYMNESGKAVKKIVTSVKAAQNLVVLHDDLDLPLGKVKISFGSGAGGHKGVASIQTAIKTKNFVRFRIGISGSTPSGKLKRPDPEKIVDFVLGKFKPADQEKLKKVRKVVEEGLNLLVTEDLNAATMFVNSK